MQHPFLTRLHLALLALLLTACSTTRALAPSPNIYVAAGNYPQAEIAPAYRTTTPKILYVTDRQLTTGKDGKIAYGIGRNASMALGEATVSFGQNLTWEELRQASAERDRKHAVNLSVQGITELVRFPETPIPFGVSNGRVVDLPGPHSADSASQRKMQNIIAARLAASTQKDVVLFVHGYHNDFNRAVLSLADIWHLTGRYGVPIAYTWPAGNKGLTGYFKDREAGEFSIYHLKETLRILAKTPGLRRIHIVAHSRGTDVVTTALREMVIEARAAGRNPRQVLKVETLILAAPDLDFGIVGQRLIAERFGPAMGQITVYINQNDETLSMAQRLMAGKRFGRIDANDLTPNEKEIFARIKNVYFINVEGVPNRPGFVSSAPNEEAGKPLGHSYFRKNPGVLSDIALTIRGGLRPQDPGRPLTREQGNFWNLPVGYPFSDAP